MDLEKSIYAALAAFLFIGAFAVYINDSIELESRRAENKEIKEQLQSAARSLQDKTADLDSLKKKFALLDQLTGTLRKLENAREDCESDIQKLEAAKTYFTNEFAQSVARVRRTSSGLKLPKLKLRSGRVYEEVKLIDATGPVVVMAHSLGVARVEFADLPDELKERFREDRTSLLSQAEGPAKAVAAPASIAASAANSPAANSATSMATKYSAPPATAATSDYSKSSHILDLYGQVARLELQKAQTEARRQEWLGKAREARSLHASASANHKISSHLVQAQQAETAAASLQNQMDALDRSILRLNQEIIKLQVSPS